MKETVILVLLIVAVVLLLVIVTLQLLKTKKGSLGDVDVKDNLNSLKDHLTGALNRNILEFNNSVNQKLLETTNMSNQNISDFRVKINAELNEFNEKLNQRLLEEFKKLNEQVEKRMTLINEKVEHRLTQGFTTTNETFQSIIERMAVIDKAQTNIEKLSTEMVSLQTLLSNNQARGAFGEFQLNQILSAIYGSNPKLYQTQYTIREKAGSREGVRADAVIFMPPPHHLIAIDSKFPFANYAKLFNEKLSEEEESKLISAFGGDVRKHITDIGNKYIIEGVTANFACMFVPSDGILTLLHSRLPNVVEWAGLKGVVLISPTLALPLLTSFKAIIVDYERSKNADEIQRQLKLLNIDFQKFIKLWVKHVESIQQLGVQSSQIDNRVSQITTKFERIKISEFEEDEESEK